MSLIPWRKNTPQAPGFSTSMPEFSRMFEDFFGRDWPQMANVPFPAVEVKDGTKAYTVKAELPGMEPGDVEIHVHDNVVTLKGEKKEEKKEEDEHFVRTEFTRGAFSRQVLLPTDVDPDHAEARMDKGVLTLKLPKIAAARRKQIKIK